MLISLLVTGGFVGFVNFESENALGTSVSGPITVDTIWDLPGSPYVIIGDITVENGVTLTIDPGVVVKFDGLYSIFVNGILVAVGTETDRINITSNLLTPDRGDWNNIQIDSNGHAEIKYCNISYGIFGLHFMGASNNNITNNNYSYNWIGIRLSDSSYNNISGNDFSNGGEGIYMSTSSNNNIINNNFSLNMDYGIELLSSSNNSISNNNISWNNGDGIYMSSSSNNTITTNYISNNHNGILLEGSSRNTVTGNKIFSNSYGIDLSINSNYNTISINTASNSYFGIRTSSSNNNNIINNIAFDNTYGIYLLWSSNITLINNQMIGDGIHISGGIVDVWNTHSIDTSNTINGKPVYYWKNQNGGTIPSGAGEVIIGNCTNVKIENQYVINGSVGIELGFSNNNFILNNTVSSNNKYNIRLSFSEYNTLINNTVSQKGTGFILYYSSNNTISTNKMYCISNRSVWFQWSGIVFTQSSNYNNVIDNEVYSNANNCTSTGISIVSSIENIVENNTISNNVRGISISSSMSNYISNNNVSSIWQGIYLASSSKNNNIINNNVSGSEYGIHLKISSDNNNIINNTVSDSNYGLYLTDSSRNRIYHNYFINNVNQAYDDMNDNFWNESYPIGGNYWSDFDDSYEGAYDDYQGPDQDVSGGDDIVDNGTIGGGGKNPYVIDGDSQDNYPLLLLPPPLPPTLYINISSDREDVILYWDPPSISGIDYYLIYRSISHTDFDFDTVWVNTSTDKEFGEPSPIPLRTMWNDTNAALPENITNYQQQYFYIIRTVNTLGKISNTSRTVGKWTKTFPQGISTFSLPLEPVENLDIDYYTSNMNAEYIKYMNATRHTWMQHNLGEGSKNNTQLRLGEGYEVKFASETNYTFCGMPGAMIIYDDRSFIGFDSETESDSLSASVDSEGNVTLIWSRPFAMDSGDSYLVYRSTTRDGFFDGSAQLMIKKSYGFENWIDLGAAQSGTQYYYMIVPENEMGVKGTSTYSIGVYTEEYLSEYDTIGITLKLKSYRTADWYCNNIPDCVGINYYISSQQRWGWHATRMPAGAFDVVLEMSEGYQISTSSSTKFTFIGV